MAGALVSIIIPTYNRARCLDRAVDSALAQTHREVDVIIVDDGSTDGTRTFVSDTYGHDPRVRYAYQDNRGVSAARNHGIRLVKGEFAALLDSDDVWKPWKLQLQLACLEMLPDAGMVWTDMTAKDPAGTVVAERYLRRFYGAYHLFPMVDLFDLSLPLAEVAPDLRGVVGADRVYCGDTVLLRRDRLEAAGFFDESVRSGEDHEFHLNACRAGRVALADVPAIDYQIGSDDALAQDRFSVPMARHFLSTLSRELERQRHRIRVPQRILDQVLADAHRWLGESLVAHGEPREGRQHLLSSHARAHLGDAYRALKRRLG